MKTPNIKQVMVIGSGTMGIGITGLLADSGFEVTLLDLPSGAIGDPDNIRSAIATNAVSRASSSKNSPFASPTTVHKITTGNIEDDLHRASQMDWVIEAISENFELKKDLFKKLDHHVRAGTILSSNTSGLSIEKLKQSFSSHNQQNFLGVHFFNPPKILRLVELISSSETRTETAVAIKNLLVDKLGRVVVSCKDTPNFIANRFLIGCLMSAIELAHDTKTPVHVMDILSGPLIGRPRTGTFRLLDLIGLDVWNAICATDENVVSKRYLDAYKTLQDMITSGNLGQKTKSGFYRERIIDGVKHFENYDLIAKGYCLPAEQNMAEINALLDMPLKDRLKEIMKPSSRFPIPKRILLDQLDHSTKMLPDIGENIALIDQTVKWGFSHELGPFEVWDAIGFDQVYQELLAAGYQLTDWLGTMKSTGVKHFYDTSNRPYNVVKKNYEMMG